MIHKCMTCMFFGRWGLAKFESESRTWIPNHLFVASLPFSNQFVENSRFLKVVSHAS